MKYKKLFSIAFPIVSLVAYLTLTSYSGGSGIAVSGCGGGCHGNSATPATLITLSGLPAAGYINGVTYALTLTVNNPSITPVGALGLRDGFILNASAGSFTAIPGTVSSPATQIRHTTAKAAPGGLCSWTFNWQAPVSGSATINFNAACNATNGNGSPGSEDKWNLFSTTLAKALPLSVTINTTPINCNGGVSTITATANNGSAPYQYKLNAGAFGTTNIFTGNPAGNYTVTVSDANSTIATNIFTITQPGLITFNAPSITNPLCHGGLGVVSVTAIGGVGITKTYEINPLGPQTNTTGNFSGLTAQVYTISATDANYCSVTTSITITQPAALIVSAANVNGCQGSPIPLVGTPAGGSFSVPNPYNGPSTTYTYTFTDGNGCSATSLPSNINATPVTGNNIVLPASGSVCQTLNPAGSTVFSNASCELIATINAGGLGSTDACINFLSGTPSWNGEPYANRVYSITPTVQPTGNVNVCLYYTVDDINAAGITSNAEVGITKVGGNGVLGGTGSVSEVLNSTMNISTYTGGAIEVCFPVSSFSSFYLHSVNPNNIPLPVVIKDWYVKQEEAVDQLYWSTETEINNQYFSVEHSTDGIHYRNVGTEYSKSTPQSNGQPLHYNFTYPNPVEGYNFYRLEQTDIDGQKTQFNAVKTYRHSDANVVSIYPNPSQGDFSISSLQPISCVIYNARGEMVFSKQSFSSSKIHLSQSGLYVAKFLFANGTNQVKKIVVE